MKLRQHPTIVCAFRHSVNESFLRSGKVPIKCIDNGRGVVYYNPNKHVNLGGGLMEKLTVHDFNRMFPDEETCLDAIRDMLYPDGITCRKCETVTRHHRLEKRKAYSCQQCGTHVYPLAGTVFAKSSTPLKSWFYAMYLIASTRAGISSKQLQRELGVTYKTALRMHHQIMALFDEDLGKLHGEVEVDETYVGGRRKWQVGRPGVDSNKTPVVGAVERKGRVVALVTKDASKATIMPIVKTQILPSTMVFTDEWRAYDSLGREGYTHRRIPHAAKVWVIGNVHTNTIEGFWSLVKRGISGVFVSVSAEHLQKYLHEYSFRYNHRGDEQPMFESMAKRLAEVRHGRFGEYAPIG